MPQLLLSAGTRDNLGVMSSDLDVFLAKLSPTVIFAYGLPLALLLYSLYSPSSLRHLPTEGGPSVPVLSYLGAFNFLRNAKDIFQRGYDKHKGKLFKVALLDRWLIIVTGTKLVDEIQRLPDDTVSFMRAASDFFGFEYIFGAQIHEDPFQVALIRADLTRNLGHIFGDLYDEIEASFQDFVPAKSDEWVAIHAVSAVRMVVARASNRAFVGLALCRNPDFLALAVDFTSDVAKARKFLAMFPPFLKPLAGKLIGGLDRRVKEGVRYMRLLVEERMALSAQYSGKHADKPNDMLQWIVDEVVARKQSVENVVRMVLIINFAAIHTSANSFTHALFHLAAAPEYIELLRTEVESVVTEEGWTKNALGKMQRLDSFMRESQRYNGINASSVMRKAMKAFTLSDGTCIPAGATLVTPALAMHFDEESYADPGAFDPLRSVRQREKDTSVGRHQFVSTAPDYMAFGLGKHACPGRFFAVTELKAMMAYLVLHYDVKMEHGGFRPDNVFTALSIFPNPDAKVLFRKRPEAVPCAEQI